MTSATRRPLDRRRRSYPDHLGTAPADPHWTTEAPGYRSHESTVRIGSGQACWASATAAVLRWQVKTRSGFSVPDCDGPVVVGERYWVRAQVGPLRISEPVEVVAVVTTPVRVGFAYGTLAGHPVSGEEAFVVHRDPAGVVFLTLRSVTGPAPRGPWSRVFPMLLLAQRVYRRRYLRSLVEGRGPHEPGRPRRGEPGGWGTG